MSKTKQGAFDTVYHHIEAPTMVDEEYGKEFKKRKLKIPAEGMPNNDIYRSDLIEFLSRLPWSYWRKVDGENIRVQWNGEQALWNGKSNAFQCSTEFADYMNGTFLEEIFEEKFGRDKVVTLFGEKMGPKTQCNELGLEKDELVLFDVNVDGSWLSKNDIVAVAGYFNLHTPYDFMNALGIYTLEQLILVCAAGAFKDWEGIVAVPMVECCDVRGNRVIAKIKTRDYCRKEEDEAKK